VIPRWLLWPLFAAIMGFAFGGSFVWGILYIEPTPNYRPAKQNEISADAKTKASEQKYDSADSSTAVPKIPSDSLSEKSANDPHPGEQLDKDWLQKVWTDPNATFAGAVAILTFALVVVGAWQARRLRQTVEATKGASAETRRIGEAQVRAYVHIKSAVVDFIRFGFPQPLIAFVASNSGQSPAINFIWNITLQYPVPDTNRQSVFNPNWLTSIGYDIPANSDAPPESALIQNMIVERCAPPGTIRTIIRFKIEYRFTDVFGQSYFGEAYFVGTLQMIPDSSPELPNGSATWQAIQISQIPRPREWDDIGQRENN
jgi:hypothetical protein